MGLFGTIFKFGKAKMNEVEEKIEDGNRIAFAKQDIEEAQEDFQKARVGLANTKASIMGLQRKVSTKKEEIVSRIDKVKKLKTAGHEDLAKQQYAIKLELDNELQTLEKSLEQYQNIYKKQESNVTTLSGNLDTMKRAIDRMKTMEEVKKSNDAIATINTDSSMSAVAKFKEREAKMQAELDASDALVEQSADPTGSLDAETEKALGQDLPGYDDL